MGRNLCDDCKKCNDNDKSITYCFDVCGVPIDILRDIEREKNAKKSDDKGMENKGIATSYYINIPEGATNGEVIKAMFPNATEIKGRIKIYYSFFPSGKMEFSLDWWNAPYRAKSEDE